MMMIDATFQVTTSVPYIIREVELKHAILNPKYTEYYFFVGCRCSRCTSRDRITS